MESTPVRDDATGGENFYLHALLGAVITVVTSMIPFSPLIGGGVAGYLHDSGTGRGMRVGAVSGAIASLPLAAIFLFMFTIMSFGTISTGEVAGPLFVVILVGAVLLFAALYMVGLSALGGYLGAAYAESKDRDLTSDDSGPRVGEDEAARSQ